MKNPLADALTGLFLVLPNIRFPVPLDGAEALATRAINFQKSSLAGVMFTGILLCALACWMYSLAVALMRVRRLMLEREPHAPWVREMLECDL